MKTKRILSFVLAAIMMMGLATTSFAAETNTHELIYQNTASYEINIPATSNIDITTGKGEIDVAVTNAKLEDWTVVAITASSANYSDGTWNLVNSKNSNDKITYTIGTTEGANDIASGDRVVTANDVTDSTLYVTVSDTSKVGTFTDTITFTSEITVDEIEFTVFGSYIETTKLTAINGMTWGDWANSEYNTVGAIVEGNCIRYPYLDNGEFGGYDYVLSYDRFSYASIDELIVTNGEYEVSLSPRD